MSRTVSQTLLDAISNQQGETILRVKTWATLAAYNLAPTVPERTWQTNKFKIEATEAEAHLITDNDYTLSDFTVFIIERGVTLAGVEYVVQSGIYFVSSYIETDGRLKIKGSSFPDQKIIIAGDDTYENVITAFCTEIGKTAVFKDTGAAWLSYAFLPTGKQVILNKAERFLNLIRQKYLILCYERSPKELVFYHATTEQSVWKDIIYADSQLMLAATSGSHEIARSTDGLAYTKIDAPNFTNAVAYSPALDLFVAVGDGVAMSSPDGSTWTTRTIGSGNWTSVTWDATLALFVAVRTGATATSANGTTWTVTGQSSYNGTWTGRTMSGDGQSICWSPELSLFVSVGNNSVNTSPDGTNWTARTPAEANVYYGVCWSPDLSLFVAVSNNGTHRVMTSPDGITWTARSAAEANEWYSVCWSKELSLFVAVAATGTNRVMTSPDGTTWTARSAAEANQWSGVCWSAELTLFVAVALNGTNRVMTSPDAITWTARSAAAANEWQEVVWSSELSLFVAVSVNSIAVMTSSDGITWDADTAADGAWRAIAWSPKLSIFAAVAQNVYTYRAMTSDMTDKSFVSVSSQAGTLAAVGVDTTYTSVNGSSWTSRTIPAGTYHKIIYADSLFVAVGASKCATSPDGITWTARTIPAGTYTGLAYSSALDLFVAVGDNLLATSPDGITWTTRTPPADQAWQAIAWSDTLAQFFAVSSDGDNRIASSTDGINWQILTTQADYSFSYLDGPKSSIEHGTNQVHFISRDETASVNTSGDTAYPAWNLGYLESTDSAPGTNSDPFYKFFLQKAPLRLDLTDGDRVHFVPSWTLDPTQAIDAMIQIVEAFASKASPAWYQEMRSLALFDSVEGGALPSTIERVAAYTPLVSSGFDGNLTPSVNNLQALAEAVDDLSIAAGPATTAVNDFQVGDGLGAWVKKTLAQTITILGIFADAASDSVYYVRRNAGWTNLKTYTDTLYQPTDSDLTAIAALSPSNDDIIQRKAGAWTNRTISQLWTDILGGSHAREKLTADRTYYVRTDGSDSNNGLANTAGGAFLTIQKAIDVAAGLDISIYNITIQIASGTYSTATSNTLKSCVGSGTVTIIGDETTPSNVIVKLTAGLSFNGGCFFGRAITTTYYVKGIQFKTDNTGNYALNVTNGTYLGFQNCDFNAGTQNFLGHLRADYNGFIDAIGNYTISSGCAFHVLSANGVIRILSTTVTLSGTPAWGVAFAYALYIGLFSVDSATTTFSGATTGSRYLVASNSVINTNGGGSTYLPGDSAGSTSTGGQYT